MIYMIAFVCYGVSLKLRACHYHDRHRLSHRLEDMTWGAQACVSECMPVSVQPNSYWHVYVDVITRMYGVSGPYCVGIQGAQTH